jgi:hypothetical protein
MKLAIIKYLLKYLAGISATQWTVAIQAVLAAAKSFKDSSAKSNWVTDLLRNEGVQGWAANLLREVAVAYAKKLKLIPS